MELMEALLIWIEDNVQKKIPVDSCAIKHKALNIFLTLKEKDPTSSCEFHGSKGWFENFKNRNSLHNLKLKGELASGDEIAAKEYPAKLEAIIKSKNYSPHQVFNADETGLFWKKMPRRTYLSKSERTASGFKAAKDRVSILFCSNASGDRMMMPLLINRSQRPRAMRGIRMENLPVHWRANPKAWMTCSIFQDWFYNCFIPEVQSYLEEKKNFKFCCFSIMLQVIP